MLAKPVLGLVSTGCPLLLMLSVAMVMRLVLGAAFKPKLASTCAATAGACASTGGGGAGAGGAGLGGGAGCAAALATGAGGAGRGGVGWRTGLAPRGGVLSRCTAGAASASQMAAMNEKSIFGLVSMMSSGVMNTHAPILRATEMAYKALDLAWGDSGAAFKVTRDQSTVRGATAAQSLRSHTPSARALSWQLRNLGIGAAPCVHAKKESVSEAMQAKTNHLNHKDNFRVFFVTNRAMNVIEEKTSSLQPNFSSLRNSIRAHQWARGSRFGDLSVGPVYNGFLSHESIIRSLELLQHIERELTHELPHDRQNQLFVFVCNENHGHKESKRHEIKIYENERKAEVHKQDRNLKCAPTKMRKIEVARQTKGSSIHKHAYRQCPCRRC